MVKQKTYASLHKGQIHKSVRQIQDNKFTEQNNKYTGPSINRIWTINYW